MVAEPSNCSLRFPDDPRKWDGWSKYRSENPYERLCLDPRSSPTDEQIQLYCAALLQWWKHKLPLKNQPSNPIAQLLGRGIDEAAQHLIEARIQLLDPEQRRAVDEQMSTQAEIEAFKEFEKFVEFSIANGVLTVEAEANLIEFGQRNGVDDAEIRTCIDDQLKRTGASRVAPSAPKATPPPDPASADAEQEFARILQLTGVETTGATYSVQALLLRLAENLGVSPERAEHLLDAFIDERDLEIAKPRGQRPLTPGKSYTAKSAQSTLSGKTAAHAGNGALGGPTSQRVPERHYTNRVGATMMLIPPGEFIMGSDDIDAAPNEQPRTPVRLTQFYISQFPVTNAQYEQFDPVHRQKRLASAGDDHPVVHVTSIDALNFCRWLGERDGKKYRLPTEAEWEYAARGPEGRKYPWGNHNGRRGFGNFADASTSFPWRDPDVNDGYAETSPIGAFPRGASFFGLHDMGGNVWEWCLDFFQPLTGTPRQNPRGPASGQKRVYRGGSWKSRFSNLRATARASNAPNYSCNDLGFRVVCECDSSLPS